MPIIRYQPVSWQPCLSQRFSEAIGGAKKPDLWDYGGIFHTRADEAEPRGERAAASAWRLLGRLAHIRLNAGNAAEPFRPMMEGPDGRSMLPEELDEATALAVRDFAQTLQDAELQAHLLDIVWARLRDPASARLAVAAYRGAADRLFDPRHWPAYASRMERAVRLARQLSDETLVAETLAAVEQRVIALDGSDPLYLTARLMEILHEFEAADAEQMTQIAAKAAAAAEAEGEFSRARAHHENVGRWRRSAGDADGERAARISIAESYVAEAAKHHGPGGGMVAAHLLEQGHEAYRRIGDTRERTAEVYALLREAQGRARESMQQIRSEGIDLAPVIKAARDRVSGKTFKEALLALATTTQTTDFVQAAATARETIERYPLQNLFGGVVVDHDGRVVARRTPALATDEAGAAQALWERVVEQTSLHYQIAVQAEIMPAIRQFTFEHAATLRDLEELVVSNPFVPPGHEETYARGILAGLRGDFPEALSLLVPQLENSLRYLLARTGGETTTRDKLGLQTVMPLGTILSDPKGKLAAIIDDNLLKELKVLFTDQHGPDLRNRIAHGLMSDDAFYSHAAVYGWWFILFLCINPVYRRFAASDETSAGEQAAEGRDGTAG